MKLSELVAGDPLRSSPGRTHIAFPSLLKAEPVPFVLSVLSAAYIF